MVGLFYAVAAPRNFGYLSSKVTGEIMRELSDKLVSVCRITSEFVVEEGAWKVEVTQE